MPSEASDSGGWSKFARYAGVNLLQFDEWGPLTWLGGKGLHFANSPGLAGPAGTLTTPPSRR